MIVTLTVNPSLDRTVVLPGTLVRGAVQRAAAISEDPGGKGVNVCRALTASGLQSVAVLPGQDNDPVMTGLRTAGVSYANFPIPARLRSNITLTEPDGTTTKINMPGPPLNAEEQEGLISLLVTTCAAGEDGSPASWLVLAGSLPPGASPDVYALVAHAVRQRFGERAPRIAIDSSGAPLLGALLHNAAPDLLKPNAEELAEVTGIGTEDELEQDPSLAVSAARTLIARGVGAVLATLGPKGALLVTAEGAWQATRPPVEAVSTVGAGDSALAGFLLADVAGAPPRDCLRQAVAHGAAAAALPGTTVPTLAQTDPGAVTVTEIAGPVSAPHHDSAEAASTKEQD
ncbi:1-phosphofructokinase family hexose kinase [Arthrobacter sp. zg-Y820]|uniref:1-phosphofructokinase family hexose kinase n=1 Tax=unclassified Arthrobacter TaxID=235627 RepID=UPI001E4C0258|nr:MULTISPECIES: 1-phosphofructokinase family hexose kinase [unclassified Arthrobacter]MCC9197492.1 1-phosphofructokinase family hexose kinase [Arthrobacter sp. zg-Y820]MDK1280359.1 1-phosphofructokinase family hexose kinase [Arthrobacter sp. zg.Y820]MDK1360506.1 1-phosphofructokinase family hexose kinase [Arthrobacter sp. zg-Y1219]WIB09642.1 1-phosphofructokinase family hexose kinase [Arthrobacter sp. zg-Y820]